MYIYIVTCTCTSICSCYNEHPIILGERHGEAARGGVGEGEDCEGSFDLSVFWGLDDEREGMGGLVICKFEMIRWKAFFFVWC